MKNISPKTRSLRAGFSIKETLFVALLYNKNPTPRGVGRFVPSNTLRAGKGRGGSPLFHSAGGTEYIFVLFGVHFNQFFAGRA